MKKKKKKFVYKNCIDCPHHDVQSDPDHLDWFCNDDVKVVCTLKNKNITVACRPYNTRRESEIPSWCPIIKHIVYES